MTPTHVALVRLMYKAACQRTLWSDVLEQYRTALHAALAVLMLWDRQSKDSAVHLAAGPMAAEAARAYTERFGALNPHMRHKCEVMVPGGITFTHRRYPVEKLVRSEYFCDYAAPLDLHAGMGLPLAERAGTLTHLACLRPFSVGLFGPSDANFAAPLIPHLRRAVLLDQHLHTLQATEATEAEALVTLGVGVLILDKRGRVLLANASARRLVDGGHGLFLRKDGLHAGVHAENAKLRRLVGATSHVIRHGLPDAGGVMSISSNTGASLRITVAPATPSIVYPVMPDACVTVVVEPIGALPQALQLRATFGMTRATARLAERLVAGDTLDEAAAHLRISRETARTHLKSVLRTSGTRRQSDFVRVAIRRLSRQDTSALSHSCEAGGTHVIAPVCKSGVHLPVAADSSEACAGTCVDPSLLDLIGMLYDQTCDLRTRTTVLAMEVRDVAAYLGRALDSDEVALVREALGCLREYGQAITDAEDALVLAGVGLHGQQTGVAAIAADGVIHHMNARAARLFDRHAGARRAVVEFAVAALRDHANSQTRAACQHPLGESRVLDLRVTGISDRFNVNRAGPAAIVRIGLVDTAAAPAAPAIASALGVTPAEARLCAVLARGRTVTQAAEDLGIKVSTVRTQLRNVFGKTGTRRQAELMAMLASLPTEEL